MLSAANVHYSASVFAKNFFDEVIHFYICHPYSIKMFHFVIFKYEDFLEFNKEYVQRMRSNLSSVVPQLQVSVSNYNVSLYAWNSSQSATLSRSTIMLVGVELELE